MEETVRGGGELSCVRGRNIRMGRNGGGRGCRWGRTVFFFYRGTEYGLGNEVGLGMEEALPGQKQRSRSGLGGLCLNFFPL